MGAAASPLVTLDHSVKLLEDAATHYIVIEVKIPRSLGLDVSQGRLEKLADAVQKAAQL